MRTFILSILASATMTAGAQVPTPGPVTSSPLPAPTAATAPAPVPAINSPANMRLQSFSWQQNGRIDVRYVSRNRQEILRADLRDGARQTYPSKDGQSAVEIKSYQNPLFVVIALTAEGDETGYIFLLERPQDEWLIMNPTAIRSRKLDLMNDFETRVKEFKMVTNFDLPNILRKMVDYFQKNPSHRMQDLAGALERRDDNLSVIPRPGGASASGGGVIETPTAEQPRARRRENRPLDINPNNQGEDYPAEEQPQPRRQRRPQPQNIDPYTGLPLPPADIGEQPRRPRRPVENYNNDQRYFPTDRPRYNQPQYSPQPQPQYAPPGYYQRPQRNFFQELFGQ